MKDYYVYIMSSPNNKAIYIGVTNDIARRYQEHAQGLIPGFTQKYNISKLIYFERYSEINDAIAREKQLKGWKRSKKEELINKENSTWNDLMLKALDSSIPLRSTQNDTLLHHVV